ncbi:MAG TPA: hypothetical protein VML95_02085 [Longimicrobiales bacterium]|nr:hypothetical protein [Longimicrobiales bacterium]
MAQLFEDERKYPDNKARQNFVFLGYPYSPAIPADDYKAVVNELQDELPVRLWYFLDEVTTAEMMRKIWRAILRCDLAILDVSGGNPNVAFELGLAVAQTKRCITLLKTGEPNPLGAADLGYAERVEYSSAATLRERIRAFLLARSSALTLAYDVSYQLHDANLVQTRDQLEQQIRRVLHKVFEAKRITKTGATTILGDAGLATTVLNKLREHDVLQVEGQKRGARWVFTDQWVHKDHEVAGT